MTGIRCPGYNSNARVALRQYTAGTAPVPVQPRQSSQLYVKRCGVKLYDTTCRKTHPRLRLSLQQRCWVCVATISKVLRYLLPLTGTDQLFFTLVERRVVYLQLAVVQPMLERLEKHLWSA